MSGDEETHPFDKFFNEEEETFEENQSHKSIFEEKKIASEPKFKENCPKCRGSGIFRSYSGRALGACRACKGKGFKAFKSSTEDRAKAKQKKAERKEAMLRSWIDDHLQEWAWILKKESTFAFASSLKHAVMSHGSLTDNQLAAVHKLMLSDEAYKQRKQAEKKAIIASAPAVSITAIQDAFNRASASGLGRPKLRLDSFIFSLAPASGNNAGAVYVKSHEDYLGKIQNGKFYRVKACTPETEQRIVAVCSDPKAAAIAYGRRFGCCSVCGRELTNKISIEAGIGPICAEKYGW